MPSPLLWQVDRIVLDCKVGGAAASTATGRALCAEIASEARRQASVPVTPLSSATDFDPLADMTLAVSASLTRSAGGRYRLEMAVTATRRGFSAGTGVRRTRAEFTVSRGGEAAGVRPLIATALRPVLSRTPARGGVAPPIPRS